MLLLGPNCLGLLDTHAGLNATGGDQPTGGVSLVSQSGNLALEVGLLLTAERQGFARFVSVGNQADLTIPDMLWSLVDHEPTRVVTCYVEDPKDGPAFVAAVRALAEAGKPPLVIKAGRTDVGARAAHSHTGSLAGSARVFAAALRDAGGIPVSSPGRARRPRPGAARRRPQPAAGGWPCWPTAAGTACSRPTCSPTPASSWRRWRPRRPRACSRTCR